MGDDAEGKAMSIPDVLSPKVHKQLDELRRILEGAIALSNRLSDRESTLILAERLDRLQSAALFVIVGEVKSGKSSFINALLGEDVCEVAPDPCTTGIQELVYGEEPHRVTLGDHWERVYLPKTVLRSVTIVDTPGTNSIIGHQQTITENYIPQSDLVVFVFPAKNPHTGSSWDFLAFIRKEWHRKTVFVLQQADLASPEELSTNLERVKQYARQRDVQNPVVFAVSAKQEKSGDADSGFAEFRRFLREAVESGDVWRMKVEGARDTTRKVIDKFLAGLRKEADVLAADRVFYRELIGKLELRREKALAMQRLVVESLCAAYDRLASSLDEDFAEGLGIGNVLRRAIPFVRDKDIGTWLKDLQSQFESRAKQEIEAVSLRASGDLSDEIQAMLEEMVQTINMRQQDRQETDLSKISGRSEVLERLKASLKELRVSDIVGDKGIQGSDLETLTLTGGGIAALGTVVALATNIMVVDITGGILATVGAGLVALALLWKRTEIIREFHQKLSKSRSDFRDRLNREIAQIFSRLFLEIDHRLKKPQARLEEQAAHTASLIAEAERIKEAIERP